MHPAVSAAMTELLKGPARYRVDRYRIGSEERRHSRNGSVERRDLEVEPGRKEKADAGVSARKAGEIAGKTGTATNADGKTSDVWLLLFVPGPPDHPENGIVLGFWMGKDSKDHPLGDRGSTGGPGFAESGARNWVHSSATVLAFLQRERGLLQRGTSFSRSCATRRCGISR